MTFFIYPPAISTSLKNLRVARHVPTWRPMAHHATDHVLETAADLPHLGLISSSQHRRIAEGIPVAERERQVDAVARAERRCRPPGEFVAPAILPYRDGLLLPRPGRIVEQDET